jgi:hypothetical protein
VQCSYRQVLKTSNYLTETGGMAYTNQTSQLRTPPLYTFIFLKLLFFPTSLPLWQSHLISKCIRSPSVDVFRSFAIVLLPSTAASDFYPSCSIPKLQSRPLKLSSSCCRRSPSRRIRPYASRTRIPISRMRSLSC